MEYLTLNTCMQIPLTGFDTFMLGGETCKNAVTAAIKGLIQQTRNTGIGRVLADMVKEVKR